MLEIVWSEKAEKVYLETLEFWLKNNQSDEYSLKIISEIEKNRKVNRCKSNDWKAKQVEKC